MLTALKLMVHTVLYISSWLVSPAAHPSRSEDGVNPHPTAQLPRMLPGLFSHMLQVRGSRLHGRQPHTGAGQCVAMEQEAPHLSARLTDRQAPLHATLLCLVGDFPKGGQRPKGQCEHPVSGCGPSVHSHKPSNDSSCCAQGQSAGEQGNEGQPRPHPAAHTSCEGRKQTPPTPCTQRRVLGVQLAPLRLSPPTGWSLQQAPPLPHTQTTSRASVGTLWERVTGLNSRSHPALRQ